MHSVVLIIVSLILILVEVFFYKRLKPKFSVIKSDAIKNFITRLICTQWLILFAMAVSIFRFFHSPDINTQYQGQMMAGVMLALLFAKIIFILSDLFARRWSWIPAVIVFFSFIYGMVFGRFNFEKKEYNVELNKEAFKGYKIIHLTDFHSISMRSASMNRHMALAGMINSEDADLIVFTGDIVTLTSAELDDFVSFFSNLKSKDGKVAVLGNHDYVATLQFVLIFQYLSPNAPVVDISSLIGTAHNGCLLNAETVIPLITSILSKPLMIGAISPQMTFATTSAKSPIMNFLFFIVLAFCLRR